MYLLEPLILTILIELGVLYLLLGEKRKKVLWASVIVNCLTNVPLNFILHSNNWYGTKEILIGELIVLIVETLWYFIFVRKWSEAFVYAFLCNAISFLIGLLIFQIRLMMLLD